MTLVVTLTFGLGFGDGAIILKLCPERQLLVNCAYLWSYLTMKNMDVNAISRIRISIVPFGRNGIRIIEQGVLKASNVTLLVILRRLRPTIVTLAAQLKVNIGYWHTDTAKEHGKMIFLASSNTETCLLLDASTVGMIQKAGLIGQTTTSATLLPMSCRAVNFAII
jgi:hypothetical protein